MTTRGLVLGAGGSLGLAWCSATLVALERSTGWDPRGADVLLGTSQGALLSGLLASGVGTDELGAWYRRELPDEHPLRAKAKARRAGWGSPLPASPGLLLRGLWPFGGVSPVTALSGLLPAGTGTVDDFVASLDALTDEQAWVPHGDTRIVAADMATGRRVVFGAPDAPAAGIREAVRASCAVPGAYVPVEIAGRTYVDGGVVSSTSVDLIADLGLDEIIVLAPMASAVSLLGGNPLGTALRWHARRCLASEVAVAEKAGASVRVLTPTTEDLRAMVSNLLDPRRRFDTFDAALGSAPSRLAAAGL